MTNYTWDIPTRNARALAYLAEKRHQAEEKAQKRHIKLIRQRNRITGVMTTGLGAIALMALISVSAFALVTFLTVIFRG
tara:strand:- start:35 stop:271 length:237 start_codon:yes stop_codon:yes gene_type:complete